MAVPSSTLADLIAREQLRTRIEAAVARLIDALDAIDAPAEDMEPSNGGAQPADGDPATVDAEGDDADREPSLGAPECMSGLWGGAVGTLADTEEQHDAEATNEDGGDINDEPQDEDTDIEPEHYRGGYQQSDMKRFATPDVHDAVAQVRRDLSRVRFNPRGSTPTMLTGFGSLPGGIPIMGVVRD